MSEWPNFHDKAKIITIDDATDDNIWIDAEKVAIAGSDVEGLLTITGASDISGLNNAGQGILVLQDAAGDAASYKMRIDSNEIQISNAGAATTLLLQPFGGNISIGNNAASNLDMNTGKIYALGTPTNAADAATKAYVDSTAAAASDNLGNHTATAALKLGNKAIQLGTANLQTLAGDNGGSLVWDANHSTTTRMQFRDKENLVYGSVYGSGNGANFGFLDGDAQWSYLAVKDVRTEFRINNIAEMTLFPTYSEICIITKTNLFIVLPFCVSCDVVIGV